VLGIDVLKIFLEGLGGMPTINPREEGPESGEGKDEKSCLEGLPAKAWGLPACVYHDA